MDFLQQLQGKTVSLIYQNIRYQGRLLDAGAFEVTLETSTGRMVLPMTGISNISPLPEQKSP